MKYQKTLLGDLLILTVLALNKEYCQYDLPKAIQVGRRISYRTVLRHLRALEDDSLIKCIRLDRSAKKGKRRKIYTITFYGLMKVLALHPTIFKHIDQVAEAHPDLFLFFKKWSFFAQKGIKKETIQRISYSVPYIASDLNLASYYEGVLKRRKQRKARYGSVKEFYSRLDIHGELVLMFGGEEEVKKHMERDLEDEKYFDKYLKNLEKYYSRESLEKRLIAYILFGWPRFTFYPGNLARYLSVLSEDPDFSQYINNILHEKMEEVRMHMTIIEGWMKVWDSIKKTKTVDSGVLKDLEDIWMNRGSGVFT